MVLTRLARSNMENASRIIVGTTVSSTLPVYTIANTITTTATRTPTVTPAVQQFISMAQERSGFFNESAISNSTITLPDYSSATARHVQEEYRGSNPPQVPQPAGNVQSSDTITPPEYSNITARTVQYRSVIPPAAPQPANYMPAPGDMFTFMREELQRQMKLLRSDMQQEIANAVSRTIPSTPGPQPAVPLFPPGQQNNLINQQQQTHSYLPGNNIQPPLSFPQNNAANTQPSHGAPPANPVQSSQAPSWPTEGAFTDSMVHRDQ
ncbi:hypothetical protein CVS40_11747 [Lucilia cuprina]|nr:hypothetical protein CVS40_11747 [Lucilia cuprina]